MLPNYLIIILNRGNGNIFNCKIEIPEIFDSSNYEERDKNKKYELIGVVSHFGESGMGGHFIAFCKHSIDNKWRCYNDSIVTESQDDFLNKGIPYILFYKKIGQSKNYNNGNNKNKSYVKKNVNNTNNTNNTDNPNPIYNFVNNNGAFNNNNPQQNMMLNNQGFNQNMNFNNNFNNNNFQVGFNDVNNFQGNFNPNNQNFGQNMNMNNNNFQNVNMLNIGNMNNNNNC